MPRKEYAYLRLLEESCQRMVQRQLSSRYVTEHRRVCRMTFRMLNEAGLETHPTHISEVEVAYILEHISGSMRNRQYHAQHFRAFVEFCDNNVFKRLRLSWPQYSPERRRWLTAEQQRVLWLDGDVEERMLLGLELLHGLRRCEVVRLRLKDIDMDRREMRVLGKGRMGGKWRTIAIHPMFGKIFSEYLVHRQSLINRAIQHMRRKRDLKVPDAVMINERLSRLSGRKRTSLDKLLNRLRSKVDFPFGHHDLRRTFGRDMYNAGVPIEKISRIYGHESIEQTIEYLGLNMDDQHDAMDTLAEAFPIPGLS